MLERTTIDFTDAVDNGWLDSVDVIAPAADPYGDSGGFDYDIIPPGDRAGFEYDIIPPSDGGALDYDIIIPDGDDLQSDSAEVLGPASGGSEAIGAVSAAVGGAVGGAVAGGGAALAQGARSAVRRKPKWYEKAPGQTDTKALPDGVQYNKSAGIYRWTAYDTNGKAVERVSVRPPTPRQLARSRQNFNRSRGLLGKGIGARSQPLDVKEKPASQPEHYVGRTDVQKTWDGKGQPPEGQQNQSPLTIPTPAEPSQPSPTQSSSPTPSQSPPTPSQSPQPAPQPTQGKPTEEPTAAPAAESKKPPISIRSLEDQMPLVDSPQYLTLYKNQIPENLIDTKPRRQLPRRADLGAEGTRTTAQGVANPAETHEFKWRVAELANIQPSHQHSTMQPTQGYPEELQPRDRDRATAGAQVDAIAANLNPDMLLSDQHMLDAGAPIVGRDARVESGSGRMMALQKAQAVYPDKYKAYTDKLQDPQFLSTIGVSPDDVSKIQNPVLVRERQGDMSMDARKQFAADANRPRAMASSPTETAMQHADAFNPSTLARISIPDNAATDAVLLHADNKELANQFLGSYSPNELASISDAKGNLSKGGLDAMREALFANVYGQTTAGKNLARELQENIDEDIVRVGNALTMSLPRVARAEALVRTGQRDPNDSIAEDIAVAVQTMRRLKRQGISVENYLRSYTQQNDNMTPTRKRLLTYFDQNRNSQRKMADFIADYANFVANKAHKDQGGFGGLTASNETKEQWLERRVALPQNTPPAGQDMTFRARDEHRRASDMAAAAIGKQRRQGMR